MLTTESRAGKKDEGRKAGATGWIASRVNLSRNFVASQALEKMVELVGLEPTTSSLRTKKLLTANVYFQ